MKIYFERSGGFMGQQVKREIDLDCLPPETAESLTSLVKENNFFAPVEDEKTEEAAAAMSMTVYDQFHFKVTIVTDWGEQHTVEAGDQTASPELQPFLHELSQLARRPQSAYDAMMAEQAAAEQAATVFPEDYPPETDCSPDDF